MNENDTKTFNSTVYRSEVTKMRERKESVHDKGQQVYRETGQLAKEVNIFGAKRLSRNAMVNNGNGTCTLINGIKLPIISGTDGTGSMGENVAKAFYAMEKIYSILGATKDRYQIDLSVAILQDVCDPHPVFQMAEFESDNRAAEHVRLLVPDKDGGDPTEDYDLGLYYVDKYVETDITNYGLKGYFFVVADQIGRGEVNSTKVDKHLGHSMQGSEVSTKEICGNLLDKWHLFYIQVKSNDSGVMNWWTNKMGNGRVIYVSDPDLLAEVQAGLIYVTETLEPTEEGLFDFLKAGDGNRKINNYQAKEVWGYLQSAKRHFGAQAKLPGYNNIPKPGSVFADYRDVWPIGYDEDKKVIEVSEKTPTSSKPIDWGNLGN